MNPDPINTQQQVEPVVKKEELLEYEFEGDPDSIIEEMESRKNEWETDMRFTKNGIVKYIDDMLDNEQSATNKKLWVSQLKKVGQVEVLVKTNGSPYN